MELLAVACIPFSCYLHALFNCKGYEMSEEQRDEVTWCNLPESGADGWPVRVVRVVQKEDKRGRPHWMAIYELTEKIGDHEAGCWTSDRLYTIKAENVSNGMIYHGKRRLAALAESCGKPKMEDFSEIEGMDVRIVAQKDQKRPEFVNYIDYKPAGKAASNDSIW